MKDADSPDSQKDVSMRDAYPAVGDLSVYRALLSTAELDTGVFKQLIRIANVKLGAYRTRSRGGGRLSR